MDENKKQTNFEINQVINEPYKYGFQTKIEKESFPSGLSEEIINLLSSKKNEPKFRTQGSKNQKRMIPTTIEIPFRSTLAETGSQTVQHIKY